MAPRVIFLMADYGHDPTETAIPWKAFHDAGFNTSFATEHGKPANADEKMLSGITGTLLGATKAAKAAYQELIKTPDFQNPLSWAAEDFTLDDYDLVFLPGGHEKGVRQIIDSAKVHKLLESYFPKTKKPSNKSVAAICHGVQVLATASREDGKSVIHEAETTALLHNMEQGIFHATRLFLGDYYKTYGAGSPSVQKTVTDRLQNPSQFKSSLSLSPFIVEDPNYNYLSARFPGDAELLASKAVEMVSSAVKSSL
ncbi:class I glutamine amidotransferase-like protein [Rhizodiscina lignyota]|uniref:Class I glutamine amidotransferase-like protein n=1 Tax=Rhizodiscina lignyota TaxID=1504668 RepID=A0A9P4IMS0_9PEZI|nr:class I glutamine amidotransferase-like protein [Rhizodiscina lignyota]